MPGRKAARVCATAKNPLLLQPARGPADTLSDTMKNSARCVIFGTGDFAQVAAVYLRDDAGYDVAAFTVNEQYISERSLLGIPVVPFESLVQSHPPGTYDLFVGVGFSKINANRTAVYRQCKELGYRIPAYIHSNVHRWPETAIGEGSFIFENNVIQPFVTIGENCVLWSGNHIGHHSTVGDNVFIASHVVVSGKCRIGDNCFLGVNVTMRDSISVGENSVIGAGALLLKDAPAGSLYKATATISQERSSSELRNF